MVESIFKGIFHLHCAGGTFICFFHIVQGVLYVLYYKYGTLSLSGLQFYDRTVCLIEIFQNSTFNRTVRLFVLKIFRDCTVHMMRNFSKNTVIIHFYAIYFRKLWHKSSIWFHMVVKWGCISTIVSKIRKVCSKKSEQYV